MDKDLLQIIKKIQKNTGITLEVSPYSDLNKSSNVKHGEPFVDLQSKKTKFVFYLHGERYVGSISGTDKVAANYAYFIQEYVENAGSSEITLGLSDYLKKIVTGDCSKTQIQRFISKFNIPDSPCYAIVIKTDTAHSADVLNVLESYLSNSIDTAIEMYGGTVVLVKFIENHTEVEYQSPSEFAEYLSRSLYEELGSQIPMGVGTIARNLQEISLSFTQALTAIKMSEIFNSKGTVHTYKEYVLIKMLEEIPRSKLRDYINVLCGEEGKEIFTDADMLNTAEEFLNNSLNVSETSRKLFMHRNTLMYRLDKIEKATGLNIRNFSDAVTFRIIIILGKLIG